jgi:diguanylate cyclase (GGDEF)-like protein/PAS domain S-box-containing protein
MVIVVTFLIGLIGVINMLATKSTILIVDDMQTNLSILSNLLKDRYKIKVAKSGKKALEIIQKGGVDLILLDIVMPDMDGYEVCKIVKNNEKSKNIPIIFVTANNTKEDEELAFALGAVDYITKPFSPSTVKARVNTHINLRNRQLQLEKLLKAMQEKNEILTRYTKVIDQNIITSSTDLKGTITHVSNAFCKISGYTKDELIGRNHRIVRHPDMPKELYQDLWKTISKGKSWEGEIKNLKKNGDYYWVKIYITPDYKNGRKIGYTAVKQDITDKKRVEELSITDGLTNIFNRRHFNKIFPKAISSSKRNSELLCFLMIDIDHFKSYNDNYGHQAGDDVLIKFATCLKKSLQRVEDLVFRLGGEEFGILYKAQTKKSAIQFANQLRLNIQNLKIEHKFSPTAAYITASMGLLCKDGKKINDAEKAFKEADDLLYKAKENGRNRVEVNKD